MTKKAFLVGANTLGLKYADKDLALMKLALEKHGYTIVSPPPTKSAIVNQFDNFIDNTAKTDTVIFYFSGHGYTPRGELQLVLEEELQNARSSININNFTDALESCRAENKLIILDCCKAGAVGREWNPEQSERYRILTASERLEEGKELDQFQASFLTYYIHDALVSKCNKVADNDGVIRINKLYDWLYSQAQEHNAKKNARQVPLPNLLGNQKANFEIGVVEQTQMSLIPPSQNSLVVNDDQLLRAYLNWLKRQHGTLELRGIRQAGQAPTIPLERVFVALKADISTPSERSESRLLLEQEWHDWISQWQTSDLSPEELRSLRWRFLARSPIMPSIILQKHSASSRRKHSGSISLGEAFQQDRWLVILGDPGSGKTTLARWITYKLADAFLKNEKKLLVPAEQADPNASSPRVEEKLFVPTEPEDSNTSSHDTTVDLGPVRLPVLVRVSDFAEARKNNSTLLLADYLGHHPWLGEIPTYGTEDSLHRGESLPADQLNGLIKSFLRLGRTVVILDGLDEIAEANTRNDIVRAVETFIRDWIHDPRGRSPFDPTSEIWGMDVTDFPAESGGNQLIITSRVAGYHIAPLSGRITHLTIEPMSDSAIDRFCDAWSLAVQQLLSSEGESESEVAARAASEAMSLKTTIHDKNRPGVRELASNPLLLAVLALIHHNTQARLPEQRVRLYQIAIENLVEVWRDTGVTEDEVVHVLAPLAAYIHDNFPTGLIEVSEVRQNVSRQLAIYRGFDPDKQPPAFRRDVDIFLKAMRERVGLLAARAEYLYGFLHLTFQEYLAARYLVRDPLTARSEILRYINNPRWREPILLALGYASWTWGPEARERLLKELLGADNPLADLLPQNTLLVAAALPELVYVPPGIVAQVTSRLLDAYADQNGVGQYDILRARVEEAIGLLHHGGTLLNVDRVLEEALENWVDRPAQARAAANLILKYKWFTPDFTELLLNCTAIDNDTWDWPIDRVLEEIAQQDWQLLPGNQLKLRTNLKYSSLWQCYLQEHSSFLKIIFAIYGGYDDNGLFQVERIRRDSPLTSLFAEVVQESSDVAVLVPKLREWLLHSSDILTYQDAALALAALSEDITTEMKELLITEPDKANRVLARINRVSASLFRLSEESGNSLLKIVEALLPVLPQQEHYKLLNQCIICAIWRLEYNNDFDYLNTFVEHCNDYLSQYHDLTSRLLTSAYTLPFFYKEEFDYTIQMPQFEFLSVLLPTLPDSYLYGAWERYLSLVHLMQYNIDFDVFTKTLQAVVFRLKCEPELISKTEELIKALPLIGEERGSIRLQCFEILHPELPDNDLERILHGIEIQESAFVSIIGGLSIAPYLKSYPQLFTRTVSMVLNVTSGLALTDAEIHELSEAYRFNSSRKSGELYKGWWFLHAWEKRTRLEVYTNPTAIERVIINLKGKILLLPPPELKEFVDYFDVDHQRIAASKSIALLTKLDNWVLFVLAVGAMIPFLDEDIRKDLLAQALHRIDEHFKNTTYDEDDDNTYTFHRDASEWSDVVARVLIEFAKYISPYEDLVETALRVTQKLPVQQLFFGCPLIEALSSLKNCIAQHPSLLQQAIDFAEALPKITYSFPGSNRASMPRIEAILSLANYYPDQRLESALEQALDNAVNLPIQEDSFSRSMTKDMALQLLNIHLAPYPRLLEKALAIALSLPYEIARFVSESPRPSQILAFASLLPALKGYPQLESRILDYLDDHNDQKHFSQALSEFAPHLAQHTRYQEHALKVLKVWDHWIDLGNSLSLLTSRIGPPRYPDSQWAALLDMPRQAEVVKVIQASAIKKTRYLTSDAVASLDGLLRLGQINIFKDILPFVSHPNIEDSQTILNWLQHDDETIVQYAALLLAEAGHMTPQILDHLATILNSSDDRMRYRAAQSISRRRDRYDRYSPEKLSLSSIRNDSVVKLAELLLAHQTTPRIATVLEYALSEIVYDDVSTVEEWIHSIDSGQPGTLLARTILVRIYSATSGVRLAILHAVEEGSLLLQEVLLHSLESMLQGSQDDEFIQEARPILTKIIASDNPGLKAHAIRIMDILSEPTSADLETVMCCTGDEIPVEVAQMAIYVYTRLIAKMNEEYREQGSQMLQLMLKKRPPIAEAASGSLVRLWVSKLAWRYYGDEEEQEHIEKRKEILDKLANNLNVEGSQRYGASSMLIALLLAGRDQDSWNDYHKELVEIINLLLEREPSLIDVLINLFENAIEDDSWQARRITLASVATVAEQMPSTFARRIDQDKLIRLLINVARTDHNVDVRSFAVQTLSLLRRTTTSIANLLQILIRDVKEVQNAVLEACKRFREVDDSVIPILLKGLSEESTIGAYSTTQLLAALGRSDGVSFSQRQSILTGLAEAIRDKRSRREVYSLTDRYSDEIEHLGSLHQAMYKAFLQVADVVGSSTSE